MRRLTRNQQLLLGAFVLASLSLWVYYANALKPLFQKALQLNRDMRATSTQLQQIEQAIAQEPRLREEYSDLTKTLQTLRAALPSEEKMPAVLERLSDLANQTGVKIQTIVPQRSYQSSTAASGLQASAAKASEFYKEISIQIDAMAGFHQLGAFLDRVETGIQPMQLRNLRISANTKEPRRHMVNLLLITYFATSQGEAAFVGIGPSGSPEGS